MRNILSLLVFIGFFSCKNTPPVEEPYLSSYTIPQERKPIGSIEATVNGKKWPGQDEVIQVTAEIGSDPLGFPCGRNAPRVGFYTFNDIVKDCRMMTGFYIQEKIGVYDIKQDSDTGSINCANLPNIGRLAYYASCDTMDPTYKIDLTKKNRLVISEITTKTITGSFDLYYKKASGFENTRYDDSLHIVCTKFIAEK